MKDIWILGGARTAFATWKKSKTGAGADGGAFKDLDPFKLGAAALKGALQRSGVAKEKIDAVILGNTYHVGPHACYGGRYVGHYAGLSSSVPGLAVNMTCGSGLYAVIVTSQQIRAGGSHCVATVGADNASGIPRNVFAHSFTDISCGQPIGQATEKLGAEYGFTRADMDRLALQSHERAAEAKKRGVFASEIVPLPECSEDDYILTGDAAKAIAEAELIFEEGGISATSFNTHGIVDGGSALILADDAAAGGKAPIGRLLAGEFAAVEPARMGYASVPAIRKVVAAAGLKLEDIDLFEINETFAAQMLVCLKELKIPEEKVNVNGGALALGHPFGATGPRQILTLLAELERRGLKRGVCSICIGGGQGVAVAVERP